MSVDVDMVSVDTDSVPGANVVPVLDTVVVTSAEVVASVIVDIVSVVEAATVLV